jgi:branched-chain amino acid transport system ATP-binding protein
MVEQDAGHALEIGHRAYVLENGAVTLTGPAAQVADDPMVRTAYLGM